MLVRARLPLILFVVLGGVLGAAPEADAQCVLSYVWTCSEDDNILRRVALDGLTVEETITISIPGTPVSGITGIAVDPVTESLFLLAYFDPTAAPFLLKYDPAVTVAQVLGSQGFDTPRLPRSSGSALKRSGSTNCSGRASRIAT